MINICVADDEFFIRKKIIKQLGDILTGDFTTFEAENGQDALNIIQGNQINLALLDIKMPRMNGLQIAEYVEKSALPVAIIIISGYGEFEYARQAVRHGVKDYLLKPISNEQLLNAVSHALSLPNIHKSVHEHPDTVVPRKDKYLCNRIIKIIADSYSNPDLNISYIAGELKMNQAYIGSVFKKEYDMSITHYINKYRIAAAQRLLQNTHKKINEIALMVGYTDTFYFSKKYKSELGYSPKSEARPD